MESAYNTSKAYIGELIGYILGGTALNYINHMDCVYRASVRERKEQKRMEMADLARQKELVGGQERNRLHNATMNGSWLRKITHHLNSTDLYQE